MLALQGFKFGDGGLGAPRPPTELPAEFPPAPAPAAPRPLRLRHRQRRCPLPKHQSTCRTPALHRTSLIQKRPAISAYCFRELSPASMVRLASRQTEERCWGWRDLNWRWGIRCTSPSNGTTTAEPFHRHLEYLQHPRPLRLLHRQRRCPLPKHQSTCRTASAAPSTRTPIFFFIISSFS